MKKQGLQLTEERLGEEWTMKTGERVVLGPLLRGQVVRMFLCNRIVQHRGEFVVYLRFTSNKVPELYGPTSEENLRQ